ncbi:hypothetical protein VB636_01245, partial [Paracoccus sp. APAP_BH8]
MILSDLQLGDGSGADLLGRGLPLVLMTALPPSLLAEIRAATRARVVNMYGPPSPAAARRDLLADPAGGTRRVRPRGPGRHHQPDGPHTGPAPVPRHRRKAGEVYRRLLSDPRTRFVGIRGLMRQKLDEG